MYIASTSLPHRLPPDAYWSPRQHAIEQRSLFATAWHLAGTWNQLARPGDFLTRTICQTPVQIRNVQGELHAFSNVCAHRHCLLTHETAGHSPSLRCQYHGWEYGSDGRTRRIPSAKEFVPFDRELHRLPKYRVDRCGQLVFISLAEHGPTLAEQLGDLAELCEQRFGDEWSESLAWDPEYPANWKVPIENSLEAYHIPNVHPETFREYPGGERSLHILLPHRTAFRTQLPFAPHSRIDRWFQQGEGWFMRQLHVRPTGEYWQHHVFPNLLFSFTDAISLCQCVIPTGPNTSVGVIRQFGRGARTRMAARRWLCRGWNQVAARITRRILQEDLQLFHDIQRGLERSPHRGLLGAGEERIHAFQEFVVQRCTTPPPCDVSSTLNAAPAAASPTWES